MIRDKSGEGLRNDRNGIRPTTVNQGGPNNPRVLSVPEANLEDLRHPTRDRIAGRLRVRPGKAAAEATMAIRRETGTKRSAVDLRPLVAT
jgi:hypothetical protein